MRSAPVTTAHPCLTGNAAVHSRIVLGTGGYPLHVEATAQQNQEYRDAQQSVSHPLSHLVRSRMACGAIMGNSSA